VEITSRSNSLVKLARSLSDKKNREREGLFLLEGVRFLEEALRCSVPLTVVFHTTRLERTPRGKDLLRDLEQLADEMVLVSESLMEYISATESPQGVLALAPLIRQPIEKFKLDPRGLYLLLEDLSDPGNTGTIFRTAQAAGAKAVFLAGGTCDPFNPKAARASMGAILSLPSHVLPDTQLFLESLAGQGVLLFGASPSGGRPYYAVKCRAPLVLILGQEARGLSREVLALCTDRVSIPMEPGVESLNVAVSAGILLFHFRRECS
jgi:TrmH family RNA methyltransferase